MVRPHARAHMTNYTHARAHARRYASGGGSYVRLNTALGAGQPDCTLLCALPAPTSAPAPAGALYFRGRSVRCVFSSHWAHPLAPPSTAAPKSGAPAPNLHRAVLTLMSSQAFPSPASLASSAAWPDMLVGDCGRGDPVQDMARVGGQERSRARNLGTCLEPETAREARAREIRRGFLSRNPRPARVRQRGCTQETQAASGNGIADRRLAHRRGRQAGYREGRGQV